MLVPARLALDASKLFLERRQFRTVTELALRTLLARKLPKKVLVLTLGAGSASHMFRLRGIRTCTILACSAFETLELIYTSLIFARRTVTAAAVIKSGGCLFLEPAGDTGSKVETNAICVITGSLRLPLPPTAATCQRGTLAIARGSRRK